jgi:hypothetical protein
MLLDMVVSAKIMAEKHNRQVVSSKLVPSGLVCYDDLGRVIFARATKKGKVEVSLHQMELSSFPFALSISLDSEIL